MDKTVNFLDRLPVEICNEILDFLNPVEWRQLRLVSKQLDRLCQRLVWRKVVVTPERELYYRNLIPSGYNFDRLKWAPSRTVGTFMLVTYRQLQELGSSRQFQIALANTAELCIYYNYWSDEEESAFDCMAELFCAVKKVTLNYFTTCYDGRTLAFQRMLDRWKPMAEFCLHLRAIHPKPNDVHIDINGMNVQELHVDRFHDAPLLLLSRSKGDAVAFSDLSLACANLTALSVVTCSNTSGWNWIPHTLKYLHLKNQEGRFMSENSPKLVVPSGVEYLHIEDHSSFGNGDEVTTTAISCIDLKEVVLLNVFAYECAGELSRHLVNVISPVKDRVEYLSVRCKTATTRSSFRFRELACMGMDVTKLRLSIGAFGPDVSDCKGFLGELPRLETLQIDLDNWDKLELFWHRQSTFIEDLVSEFLRGCQKLSRIQLESTGLAGSWRPWIAPSEDKSMYLVDITKAKSLLMRPNL